MSRESPSGGYENQEEKTMSVNRVLSPGKSAVLPELHGLIVVAQKIRIRYYSIRNDFFITMGDMLQGGSDDPFFILQGCFSIFHHASRVETALQSNAFLFINDPFGPCLEPGRRFFQGGPDILYAPVAGGTVPERKAEGG